MEIFYRIQGNESLLLNDREKVWLVQSGSLSVFVTTIQNGLPQDDRRYLFSVSAGEVLFGAIADLPLTTAEENLEDAASYLLHSVGGFREPPLQPAKNEAEISSSSSLSLLAVALDRTELSQISIDDLAARVAGTDKTFVAMIESWAAHLYKSLNARFSAPTSERKNFIHNLENVTQIFNTLDNLHADFFNDLQLIEQQENETAFRQFQERDRLNREVAKEALSKLAATLQPQEEGHYFQAGTPLLVAAGAVARSLGIKIRPSLSCQDLSQIPDPVEAIARASKFRTRRITLEDNWWRKECGPLLAYWRSENQPIALLPAGDRYILLDPATGQRMPVNRAIAAMVAQQAYQFYRPLPEALDKAIDLFQFGIKGNERDIAIIFALGIIGSLLGMVVPQATGLLVDYAIPDADRSLLGQIALALLALAFGRSLFQLSQGIFSLRVTIVADSALQLAVWDRLLRLSPAFFRQYTSGDLLNRATAANQIRQKLAGGVQRSLLNGLFALLNLALMFVYSWPLALVGMGIALLAAIVTAISSFLMVRKSRRQLELDGAIAGLTVQLINGVAKLRVAAAEQRAFAAWADRYSQRIRLKAGFQRIDDSVSVFNEVLPLVTSALLFWFAILSMQMTQSSPVGGMTSGTFLAFNAAFGLFIKGMVDLSNILTDLLGIVPLWERSLPILQAQPESNLTKANPGVLSGRVALDRVSFRYRDDGPLVLNEVSISAERGEFIAIVGPSGSGKSTILRLLLGFETPLSGTVYYDRQDLADLEMEAVRRQLGVVLQNGRIGSGSIFDNIAAGALVSREEAWEAARMAGLAEDIEQMPMEMHTVIGEGGTNLSGGQRQRLLIARALVRKPKIILFDEATSSLDNRTQAIVTESLEKLNATRIAIAHRLSTIRHADRIYAIESGRVVQVGTFEELIKQEGLFARLIARQIE